MSILNRKTRSKAPATIQVGIFHCAAMSFPIPREQLSKTEFLTRKKRTQPGAFEEAVEKLETEIAALTGGKELTVETWASARSAMGQARVKASMAVLMSFGVTHYPVPADQEARARALAAIEEAPSGP